VVTTDSRLTDARAPTSHAASHATGGSDAITAANIGAAATSHSHAATDISSGTLADARLSSAVALHSAINAYDSGPPSGFDIYPRGEAANLTMTINNGVVYFSFFTPAVTVTISSMTMFSGTTSASSGLTLARMGIYTFDETTATLVARTASDTTLYNTVSTAYQRSFATAGGFPASYQLTAGTRYGVGIIFVGTTMPVNVARLNSPAVHTQTPRTTANLGSQSDLPTTAAASAFGIQQGMPFARLS
jgi:hypothetical protein